jgi:uncharacterized protein YjiS (DUF1127 family)
MSIITAANSPGAAFGSAEDRRPGLLSRVFHAILESRRLSAERKVGAHLDAFSDAHLSDIGLSAAEIESIRAGRWRGRTS